MKKLFIALVSLFLLVYIGYQAYLVAYEPYETVIVKQGAYTKELELNGCFVRDEALLTADAGGVVGYRYQNAEKVPINADVAHIYKDETDLHVLKKKESLVRQRDILKQMQTGAGGEGLKIDLVKRQLTDAKFSLMRAADTGSFSNLDSLSNEILLCLNRYALCVGEDLNLDELIRNFDDEIAALDGQTPSSVETVKAAKSGYFCSITDGFERTVTPALLEKLTVSSAQELLIQQSGKTAENVIGKMTYSSQWHFVSVVPAADAVLFKENSTVPLTFTASSVREVNAVVERVITEKDNENAVVVFSGNDMDSDFLTMRQERPRVLISSYSGVVIPKEAVRIRTTTNEDGTTQSEKVVYAMFGHSARMRRLDIVYEDEAVIVSNASGQTGYVSAYDQVIIKGKELNDAEN